jgi:hypothetical protein
VAAAVVKAFTGFGEWIAWSYFGEQNGHLFKVLCNMLGDEKLQLPAAECLLLICSRKVIHPSFSYDAFHDCSVTGKAG